MDKIRIPLVKNSLLALSLFGLVIYCSEDPEVGSAELIGKWQLSEVLFDPGDGSGEFQPVESDKAIDFLSNGKVRSNGDLCYPNSDSDSPSTGYFILPDSILDMDNCAPRPFETSFRVVNSELIIDYVCIEACSEKYIKIE